MRKILPIAEVLILYGDNHGRSVLWSRRISCHADWKMFRENGNMSENGLNFGGGGGEEA